MCLAPGVQESPTRMVAPEPACELMLGFCRSTGLCEGGDPGARYLWTDALAVCTLIGLFEQTGEKGWVHLATRLIDAVHDHLGRHRDDDRRSGWLSGLCEEEGARHPTLGGLRIGKRLPERRADQPLDDALEWDRDGQYYHYLVKWIHALERASGATRSERFHRWAVELAVTAQRAFTSPDPHPRMYWKMSIDLSRPLVASMAPHDPVAGWVACHVLRRDGDDDPALTHAADALATMCRGPVLVTADPLGIGDLLFEACKLAQLGARGDMRYASLLDRLLDAALLGLDALSRSEVLRGPASMRLGFREAGLAIGLGAIDSIATHMKRSGGERRTRTLERLARYAATGDAIQAFWLDAANRSAPSWDEHRNISDVMLATSLAPQGYLRV